MNMTLQYLLHFLLLFSTINACVGDANDEYAEKEASSILTRNTEPPSMELPRPLLAHRKQQNDDGVNDDIFQLNSEDVSDEIDDEEKNYNNHNDVAERESKNITTMRSSRSRRRGMLDVAVEASVREGLSVMTEFYGKIEPNILKNGQLLAANHPAALLSKFSAPLEDTENKEIAAYATIAAAKAFQKNFKQFNELARQAHAPKVSLRRTALEGLCPPRDPPTCMPASERYRTHDGTCNNKRRPRWGAAQMPFTRFLPPEYGDGVDAIRNSVDGGPLSSARFVSLLVHGAKNGEAPLTLMTAQWGQLLDHDMTSTAQPRSINGSVPSCCGGKDFHPSCFPIKVPQDDPWLAPLKVRCLEFLRSAPAQRRDCVLSWREQTNQATSYIDASPIYSSSAKGSDHSRLFRNGLLFFGRGTAADDICKRGALATQCIRSGDGRSSEQPGLLALHHVWVTEHNRIALELGELNLHWSDEKIYQETRRIIGAMFQHITYREFLPIIVGREVCKLFDLELLNSGYYEGYNPKTNPSVANSFAAAAFRFGHSLIQNSYIRCDRHHNKINTNVSLHEEFQRGDIGSAGSLHRLLRGMASQRALRRDEFITPELTNHLFQTPGFPFGLDLAAINIQRGRDHGIPPYTAWRVPCGLSPITNWDDFAAVVGPESAKRIGHAYSSVHDIDLFVGGISERPVVGGLVGPTFACIIAQQFSNSRKGDRLWYENGGFESSFTPAQLNSIRQVSLAQVLCRTVGGGTFQPHIFIPPEFPGNERLPCGSGPLAPIDLSPWLEQDPFLAPLLQSTLVTTDPDRVFEIAAAAESLTDHTQMLKGNNTVHSNHIQALDGSAGIILQPHMTTHVGFIPHSSVGSFQRPQDASKIDDKLDFKRTATKRPTQKPIAGVNNKLDKRPKITLSIQSTHTRHRRPQTTTRRTVVVNNIPFELRSAVTDGKTKKTDQNSEFGLTKDKDSQAQTTKERKKTTTRGPTPHSNGTENYVDDEERTTRSTTERNSTIPEKKLDPKTKEQTSKRKRNIPERNQDERILDHRIFPSDQPEPRHGMYSIKSEIEIPNTIGLITSVVSTKNDIDPSETDLMIEPIQTIRNVTDFNYENLEKVHDQAKLKTRSFEEENPLLPDQNDSIIYEHLKPVKDLDPITHSTSKEHKRVRRKLLDRMKALQLSQNGRTAKFFLTALDVPTNSTSKLITTTKPTTTKRPRVTKATKTTLRNVELRQYHTRPIYTRPQKVVVNGPNSDQYEIEINIRQTNKAPALPPTPSYTDHTTPYTLHRYDRYTSYNDFRTTTPIYGYGHHQHHPTPPNGETDTFAHNKRTKPPTIIYLNELDERTTRKPTLLQNFLTLASSGLDGIHHIVNHNSGHKQKEKPVPSQSTSGIASTLVSSPHSSVVSSSQYIREPQLQPPSPVASSSFSQVTGGSYPGHGQIAHASSGAVSSGDFGSIMGLASSDGADSTFSFSIRPRPVAGTVIEASLDSEPTWRPAYSHKTRPSYINVPHEQNYEQPIPGDSNSPFSTGHHRPLQQSHYSRTKVRLHQKETISSNGVRNPTDHSVDAHDYDYLSKNLEPNAKEGNERDNDSKEEDESHENIDLLYDDEVAENAGPSKKFDRDGYLRPEHMIGSLLKNQQPRQNSSTTKFINAPTVHDDQVVLSALNRTELVSTDLPLPMERVEVLLNFTATTEDLSDTKGKHFDNTILAEDYDHDMTTETSEPDTSDTKATVTTETLSKTLSQDAAFAPINVLTKPERPDNWVFYDMPVKKSLLPELPEISVETFSAAEVPIPFADVTNVRINKYRSTLLKARETKRRVTTTKDETEATTVESDSTIPGTNYKTRRTNTTKT